MSTQLSTPPSEDAAQRSVTTVTCARSPLTGLWVGTVFVGALLVLPLVVDIIESGSLARVGLLLVVLAAAITPYPAAEMRPRQAPWLAALAAAALAVVAVVSTREFGGAWYNTWLILAIVVGHLVGTGLLSTAAGMWGVVTVTVAAGLVVNSAPHDHDQVWAVMLTVVLAGVSSIVLVRLLSTIDQLRATRRELAEQAVLAERDRFSRDLHDLLGHSLSLVVVKSELVSRLTESDPAKAAEHADDITAIGRRALTEIREAVAGIRRTTLAAELARARTALTDAGIEAEVANAPSLLPEHVDEAFAWVVREGATNVLRHSGARHCTMRVEVVDDRTARLAIVDDGPGVATALAEGNGLTGLRSRLALVDGELLVVRDTDSFGLTATAPLEEGR
jgi:two-component system sensor histidine kinase DesK